MVKTIATILGIVFLIVGIAGFVNHNLLGAHLSMAHNVIHIVSGVISLYLGLQGSLSATAAFAIAFGLIYLLLGIAGYLIGGNGLFRVIPGTLELGPMDHNIHIVIGVVYLLAGLYSKTRNA